MRTVQPVPVNEWDKSLQTVLADMNGRPLNVHSLMAHHPALLKAWWDFRNYSVNGGDLGKRLAELVILRVATHMKSWYEWASHVERSIACGLTLEEIERVKSRDTSTGWAPDEALLLRAVDQLITTHGLSDELRGELESCFSTPQLMDIIAIHGMYVILGCMINTWGLPLDAHVAEILPAEVNQKQFEGEFPRK